MSIKDKVKSLLKEADLYKSQRLLKESKIRYLEAIELINNNNQIPNRDSLIDAITKKVNQLDDGIVRWDKSASTPEVSPKVQDLIKKLFTPENETENESVKALKGAITLAKFGQYKRAIKEFNQLIRIESISVPAAKNSLKCIIEISSIDDAVAQYRQWMDKKVFSADKGILVKQFLQDVMDKKGVSINIDAIDEKEETKNESPLSMNSYMDQDDEDIIDITSIGIRFNHGPKKGDHVELDVSFQAGNVLSLIVSNSDKLLIESLKVGVRLDDMDFYSPIAIFKGSGVVEANTRIESGPKRGDYSLDIKIHSI
jgi:tetratricopeptide (TPR) repeat protein